MIRHHSSVRRNSRTSGYTLIELTVSILISSILLVGMGSSMFIAARASTLKSGVIEETNDGSEALRRLSRELQYATALNSLVNNTTTVEFTVADITGDHVDDVIRYQWSGIDGDPLERTVNGGTAEVLVDYVYDFLMEFEIKIPTYQEFTEGRRIPLGTSVSITTPPDTASGDLLIAAVSTDGNTLSSLTAPAGWNLIMLDKEDHHNTFGVWWKLADSEPSSHEFSWSPDE